MGILLINDGGACCLGIIMMIGIIILLAAVSLVRTIKLQKAAYKHWKGTRDND